MKNMDFMRVLKVTIGRKLFEQVLAGNKTEEYRDIKPYWTNRLRCLYSGADSRTPMAMIMTNGYSERSRWLKVELLGVSLGARNGVPVYILKLGAILDAGNL